MLLWTDLETTGLDPDKCAILEVAAIVTDDRLTEVARFEQVLWDERAQRLSSLGPEAARSYGKTVGIDPYVVDMHRKNELWEACKRSGYSQLDVDVLFAAFVEEHALKQVAVVDYVEGKPMVRINPASGQPVTRLDRPQLAGSTISFDRGFLAKHCPVTEGLLHHRNVDVSSFNEVARRFWPQVYEKRPKLAEGQEAKHRAMGDILESIAVMKYYLDNIGPHATETLASG